MICNIACFVYSWWVIVLQFCLNFASLCIPINHIYLTSKLLYPLGLPCHPTLHRPTQLDPRCWTHLLAISESLSYSLFLSDRKWLTYVRSIYQIWQRDTVHLNWLSILGMALSTCGSMKMNLMLSLQTHQILLVCIIIIIIIIIIITIIAFPF